MPTMVKAAKRTTGRLCVLTNEGCVVLSIEPRQELVQGERTCVLTEREIEVRVDGRRRGAKSGTKSFI